MSVLLQLYSQDSTPELEEVMHAEGFKILSDDMDTTYRMAYGKLKRMSDDLKLQISLEEKKETVHFDSIISDVERFQGYSFDQDKMTVKHFAGIYKKFKQHEREN